ncbi:hypothetical protein ONK49_25565, partial [Salmonella enterica subsp. enterica serovar Lubbock]|nr:hypothetical protein [Salmonella enterica subsp. enterica serovar Lubbock]
MSTHYVGLISAAPSGVLEKLGAVGCQVVQGGVHFQGDTRLIYQSLMWSRLASRIILPM